MGMWREMARQAKEEVRGRERKREKYTLAHIRRQRQKRMDCGKLINNIHKRR